MSKKLTFLFFLIPLINFGQDFQWVRQIKGIVHEYADFAEDSTVDSDGSTYVVGRTESLLFDLDPTPTGTEIVDNTAVQNFAGTYLVKVDSNGNYLWGLTFGNYRRGDNAYSVKIGTDGNVYVLLSLQVYNSSINVIDSYITIIKISPTGTILFTKSILQNNGNSGIMFVNSLDLDNQNNMYLTGYFVGSLTIQSSNLNLTLPPNAIGNYVLKIDNTGNCVWVKQLAIPTASLENKLLVRPDGNVNLFINNNNGYNLINLNSNTGDIIWQKDFINQVFTSFHVSPFGIVIPSRKIDYWSTIDVDPSNGVSLISSNCNFIVFLSLNGDFEEVKIYERDPDGDLTFTAVTTDAGGKYYLGGAFGGNGDPTTIDFDASGGVFNLTTPSHEGFLLKLDENRNFENAVRIGIQNPFQNFDFCYSFYIRKINVRNDNSYITGEFEAWCDFDPSTTSNHLLSTFNSATINKDGFILKLGPCDSQIPNGDNTQVFCSAQNPTVGNLSPNSSSYRWYDSLTSVTPLTNATSLIDGHVYYVSKQFGNCPESPRLPVTVTINQSPNAPISSNQTFCESENALLSDLIVTGQNIEFYETSTGGNELSGSTLLINNTNYYASQTVNDCESSRTVINVTITPSPIPDLFSPQPFCIQQNATINDISITGQNIQWYDAPTGGNLLNSSTVLQNGITYYASQTLNSCESSRVSVNINIQNTAAPTANSPQSFCAVQSATLADIVVNGSDVKWYATATSTSELPQTTVLADNTTYFATQTVNGCESVNRLPITISLIYSLNANNYATTICDEGNNGTEAVDLSQFDSYLVTVTGNTFTYYKSYNGAENQIAGEQLNTNHTINLGLNTIFVRIDSANGCQQIVQLQLTLVTVPIINIPNEVILCENSVVSVHAGSGFNSYLWSTNATTPSIAINQAGNYSVTVTKNHGSVVCSSTKNFTVVLSNAPTINSINIVDWTDTENSITVNVTGLGDYEYSIDGVNFQNSNIFNGLPNGAYLVTVRDKNNCGMDTEQVFLLNYPKFFTPNSDGNNDGWSIKFSQFEPNFEVRIFDRYGKLLRIMSNDEAWDGNYNGRQLPSDDYWFTVTRNDGRIHKGHFAMLR